MSFSLLTTHDSRLLFFFPFVVLCKRCVWDVKGQGTDNRQPTARKQETLMIEHQLEFTKLRYSSINLVSSSGSDSSFVSSAATSATWFLGTLDLPDSTFSRLLSSVSLGCSVAGTAAIAGSSRRGFLAGGGDSLTLSFSAASSLAAAAPFDLCDPLALASFLDFSLSR